MNNFIETSKKNTSKYGIRACIFTAVLLVSLILINCFIGLLPKKVTSFDISDDNRYSITDSTKRFLAKNNKKVDIYMLANGGEDALEDQSFQLSVFLERMVEYGDHISFSVVDPLNDSDITDLPSASNGSIVVKSESRYRILPLSSFFYLYIEGVGKVTSEQAQLYLTYYGSNVDLKYAFEGENLLLNAIAYVSTDTLPKVYALSGHGEGELASSLISTLSDYNVDLGTLTLTENGIPADCSLLLINLPTVDINAAETALIQAYLDKGGKIFLVTSPDTPQNLPNLMAISETFGLSAQNGIVMEVNTDYYYQLPYYLIPAISNHQSVSQIMLPLAHGICIVDSDDIAITPIFSTSAEAYIVPTDATTMEKPEGQDSKIHNIGVISKKQTGGTLLWVSSLGITDETANSYMSGNNYKFLSSFISDLCDAPDTVNGELAFLSLDALTVPTASAAIISSILILVIPTAIIAFGFVYWIRRRRK